MFKKFIVGFAAMVLIVSPVVVSAVDLDSSGYLKNAQKKAGFADANETTLAETVGKVIGVALSLIGTIFTVLILYAGFLWMTAGGETDKIDKAKNILKSSVIGLLITLAAYSISNFVVTKVVETTLT